MRPPRLPLWLPVGLSLCWLMATLPGCATAPAPAPTPTALPAQTPAAPVAPISTPDPPTSVFPRTAVMDDYIRRVKAKIRSQMRFPPTSAQYETLFQISLKPDMQISRVQVVRSSGNPRYDAAAKRAIEQARSYPPLPEGLDFNLFASHKIRYKLHDTP